MLHLFFESLRKLEERESFVQCPSGIFDWCWKSEWLDDPFSRKMIQEIDHVDIPDDMDTEKACLLKNMRVENLSSGTKGLILCKYYNRLNRMTMMGPNCYKYLMDIADEKDVYMGCSNYVFFTDEDLKGRKVHFVNTDDYVSTAADFAEHVHQIIGSGILGFTSVETCK